MGQHAVHKDEQSSSSRGITLTIPTELANCNITNVFFIIPTELGQIYHLEGLFLNVSETMLTGAVPSELCFMDSNAPWGLNHHNLFLRLIAQKSFVGVTVSARTMPATRLLVGPTVVESDCGFAKSNAPRAILPTAFGTCCLVIKGFCFTRWCSV